LFVFVFLKTKTKTKIKIKNIKKRTCFVCEEGEMKRPSLVVCLLAEWPSCLLGWGGAGPDLGHLILGLAPPIGTWPPSGGSLLPGQGLAPKTN